MTPLRIPNGEGRPKCRPNCAEAGEGTVVKLTKATAIKSGAWRMVTSSRAHNNDFAAARVPSFRARYCAASFPVAADCKKTHPNGQGQWPEQPAGNGEDCHAANGRPS